MEQTEQRRFKSLRELNEGDVYEIETSKGTITVRAGSKAEAIAAAEERTGEAIDWDKAQVAR